MEFEETDENQGVITEILERRSYLKRPKVSNISKIIFVIAPKMPAPNLIMLDKGLCLAKFLGIDAVIVINKTDLDEKEADRIFNIYKKAGYIVIKTKAEKGEGLDELKNELKENTSVLSRKLWCSESQLLQINF